MDLKERLDRLATRMTLRESFIAAVVSTLPRRIVDKGTGWTNGSELVYAREFCDKQDDDQLFGLMLHESLHVVCMHMWRREGRNPYLWNIATDAWINFTIKNMVNESGRKREYKLPDGGVDIPWVTEKDDAESIYHKLLENPPPSGGGDGKGKSGDGDADGPGGENADEGQGGWNGTGDLRDAMSEAQRADMQATIMAAAKMAKACGDKSQLVNRILGGDLEPTVNWKDEVMVMLTSSARDDFSYARVNRRFVAQGLYLPSLHSDAIGGLIIGFDTSGSVGSHEAEQIAGEIQGIVDMVHPDWIEVVYCDADICGTQRFERDESLVLEVKGGGGTRFKPVFDYANSLDERIAGLIYLTDLCGPLNEIDAPEYPVIWGTTMGDVNAVVPFGKVVRVVV